MMEHREYNHDDDCKVLEERDMSQIDDTHHVPDNYNEQNSAGQIYRSRPIIGFKGKTYGHYQGDYATEYDYSRHPDDNEFREDEEIVHVSRRRTLLNSVRNTFFSQGSRSNTDNEGDDGFDVESESSREASKIYDDDPVPLERGNSEERKGLERKPSSISFGRDRNSHRKKGLFRRNSSQRDNGSTYFEDEIKRASMEDGSDGKYYSEYEARDNGSHRSLEADVISIQSRRSTFFGTKGIRSRDRLSHRNPEDEEVSMQSRRSTFFDTMGNRFRDHGSHRSAEDDEKSMRSRRSTFFGTIGNRSRDHGSHRSLEDDEISKRSRRSTFFGTISNSFREYDSHRSLDDDERSMPSRKMSFFGKVSNRCISSAPTVFKGRRRSVPRDDSPENDPLETDPLDNDPLEYDPLDYDPLENSPREISSARESPRMKTPPKRRKKKSQEQSNSNDKMNRLSIQSKSPCSSPCHKVLLILVGLLDIALVVIVAIALFGGDTSIRRFFEKSGGANESSSPPSFNPSSNPRASLSSSPTSSQSSPPSFSPSFSLSPPPTFVPTISDIPSLMPSIFSPWEEIGNDLVSNGSTSILFGRDIALSENGSTLAVCSSTASGNSITIYKMLRNTWTTKGLPIFGSSEALLYGQSIDMSSDGSIIAIGERQYLDNTGIVKVYEWKSTTWSQKGQNLIGRAKLGSITGPTFDHFGALVALSGSGSQLLVAATITKTYEGRIDSFSFDGPTSTWIPRGNSIAGEVNSYITENHDMLSMTKDGNFFAFGSALDNEVKVERWNGTDWEQLGSTLVNTTIIGPGKPGYGYQTNLFGSSVQITNTPNGLVLSVGSACENYKGAVHVFDFFSETGIDWVERADHIDAPSWVQGDNFGTSLRMSQDGKSIITVSNNPSILLRYDWNITTSTWDRGANVSSSSSSSLEQSDSLLYQDAIIAASGDGYTITVSYPFDENGLVRPDGVTPFDYDHRGQITTFELY